MVKSLLIVLVGLGAAAWVAAQDCNEFIDATTPTHRFALHDDATVTGLYTGLRWQRCPIGYVLDTNNTSSDLTDDECRLTGTAVFTWQQALQAADDINSAGGFAGFTDWRVPSIKELASIIEYRCVDPAINQAVFPDTAAELFWTSTSYNLLLEAAVIDFENGENSTSYKDQTGFAHYVRLVRDDH